MVLVVVNCDDTVKKILILIQDLLFKFAPNVTWARNGARQVLDPEPGTHVQRFDVKIL